MSNFYIVMPTKNEASRYLSVSLASALNLTSNVFVYDDQSDDETVAVATELGATVRVRDKSASSFRTHEGEFRQGCWNTFVDTFRPKSGDWVLAQDADEILYNIELLPEYFDQTFYDVIGVAFYHMWNATHYRVDKAWKPTVSSRLFRFYPGGEFAQRRLACGSEPAYVQELIRQGKVFWNSGLAMQHLGYAADGDKLMKYQRYMELDGGDFHSRHHIESIIDPHPILEPFPFF